MESGLTTEELFAELSPEERAEALRLATRLQAKDNDSATLLAAAREAGIEERYLREAASQTRRKPGMGNALRQFSDGSPDLGPNFLTVLVLILYILTQGFAATSVVSGTIGEGYLPVMAFAGVLGLGIGRARPRWFTPAIVLTTWFMLTAIVVIHAVTSGRGLRAEALSDFFRIVAGEMVLAYLGAALASALSKRSRNSPPPNVAVPE